MDDVVIVNDGQHRWGASRSELIAALERGGWVLNRGDLWAEPTHVNEDFDAYAELCQRVKPLPRYTPDEACSAWNDLPQFMLREDLGEGVWQYGELF